MTRLTRTRVAVTTGLTLTTAGLGLALAPAALAAPLVLPELDAPTQAVVGQPFDVSGTDCDAPDGETAIAYVEVYSVANIQSEDDLDPLFGDAVDVTDGAWTAEVVLGADVPAGDYVIWASCEPYDGAEFSDYDSVQFALGAAPSTPTTSTPTTATPSATPAATPGAIRGAAANTPGVAPAASSAATTTTPAPGQKVVKVYKGFKPGEKVTLTMHSTPTTLGVFTADANGFVTVTFTVPAGTAAGTHTLVLEGDMGTYFQENITVAAALTTASSAGLAYTGADVAVPLALGAGLLVVGGGALVASRRRTGATQA